MDGSKLFELHLVESLKFIRKSDLILSSYQKEALKSVLAERDTFVSLLTGHGKSIVFELLPYLLLLSRFDHLRHTFTIGGSRRCKS
jgi:superfamily II DNA/RNA helicase